MSNLVTDSPGGIQHEVGDRDAWHCLCGNQPPDGGFFPVNSDGQEVEPTPQDWDTANYKCADCGRIINGDSLEYVK
jgi:hypothetical protein